MKSYQKETTCIKSNLGTPISTLDLTRERHSWGNVVVIMPFAFMWGNCKNPVSLDQEKKKWGSRSKKLCAGIPSPPLLLSKFETFSPSAGKRASLPGCDVSDIRQSRWPAEQSRIPLACPELCRIPTPYRACHEQNHRSVTGSQRIVAGMDREEERERKEQTRRMVLSLFT